MGRARELATARARLSADPAGSVLVVGPLGIGKSTLLEASAAEAVELGFAVRRTRAAAAESDLPFVGLTDLIGEDAGEFAADLPTPLRRALDMVLLRTAARIRCRRAGRRSGRPRRAPCDGGPAAAAARAL